jgi:hypothetical protein
MVIPRRRFEATRTDCLSTLPRPDRYFDRFLIGTEAGVLVDKALMVVAVV